MSNINDYIKNYTVGINNIYRNNGFPNINYQDLAVAKNIEPYIDGIHIGLVGAIKTNHSEVLDPTTRNTLIGSGQCEVLNLCVPAINVPDITKKLSNELEYDTNNNLVTPLDKIVSNNLLVLSEKIKNLPTHNIPSYISTDDLTPEFVTLISPVDLTSYSQLNTNSSIPLTTQSSVACRPETQVDIPNIKPEEVKETQEMTDMLSKLGKLLKEDVEPDDDVIPVNINEVTNREIDGSGAFDWLAKATLNQIEYGINRNLWTKAEARELYANALGQVMEHGVQFALNKEQAKWQSLLLRNQIVNANLQSLLVKAELIMMPAKVKLSYAQLQAQLKQLDLLNYQIELEKHKLPQVVAQTDQIKEQTALICQQRKQAIEQLAQAEFDRKIKQEQVTQLQLDNQLKAEQITQSKQQTKQMVAQTEQTVEQSKLINAQMQATLADIRIKDMQILQGEAQLQVQAQQLLKEKEQIALLKAQVASTYASVTAQTEQLKTIKAQYSDTIDGQPIGGILGAQMNVNKAQAMGFERQAFNNFVSQLQAGWTTKKTADMATMSPNAFTALGLDRVLNWYGQKYFNMPNNTFELPDNYTDFLTDDQMDGKESSNVNNSAVG